MLDRGFRQRWLARQAAHRVDPRAQRAAEPRSRHWSAGRFHTARTAHQPRGSDGHGRQLSLPGDRRHRRQKQPRSDSERRDRAPREPATRGRRQSSLDHSASIDDVLMPQDQPRDRTLDQAGLGTTSAWPGTTVSPPRPFRSRITVSVARGSACGAT